MKRFSIIIFFTLLLNIQLSYCQNTADSTKNSISNEPAIFTVVEQQAEFKGGMQSLFKFINNKIDELMSPKEIEVDGKVILKFNVEVDGSLTDIKIIRGLSNKQDEAALKVVESMKYNYWLPGKRRGMPIKSNYMLPISFKKKYRN